MKVPQGWGKEGEVRKVPEDGSGRRGQEGWVQEGTKA